MSHLKWKIFQTFAPHPFFMQVRKRPIQKKKWSLFACMPKGLHAPRYKTEFQGHLLFFRQNICFIRRGLPLIGYQRLFYSQRKQNTSSAMSTEIDKGEWHTLSTHITLTRESHSSPTPFSNHRREYGLIIYLSRKPTLYPKFSCRSKPGCMPPGFQSRPRITRAHRVDRLEIDETFLVWKDNLGMVYDYLPCVNWEMKAGLRAWPLFLRAENTLL